MHLIDITQDITTAPVYSGDPETVVQRICTIGEESDCNLSVISACLHAGTRRTPLSARAWCWRSRILPSRGNM